MKAKLSVSFGAALLISSSFASDFYSQTLFTQDFSASTAVSDYVAAGTANKFDAISSSNVASIWSINNGALQFDRTATGSGSATKLNLNTTAPVAVSIKFDFGVNSSVSTTNAANFIVGSGVGTANSAPANAATHSKFGVNTIAGGSYSFRDISGSANGTGTFSGIQTVSWFINNGTSPLSYLAPDGTVQTVAVDKYDLWVGSSQTLDERSATTATVDIKDFKFLAVNTGVFTLDNISIKDISTVTIWNGTAWSNGVPDNTKDAIINGDYSGAYFECKDLTINTGKTLTVNAMVGANNVINNGNIIVNSNGTFVQTTGGIYTAGAGSSFVLNRTANGAPGKYGYWSSPVSGQDMFTIYGTGNTPGYVMTYNTASDTYNYLSAPAVANSGIGYAVKVPLTVSPGVTTTFTGLPNNGDISVPLVMGAQNYNLVGNPYPSDLSLLSFYPANSANIGSTMWFWDNTSSQLGSTASNQGYATYNGVSETWVSAPSSATVPTGNSARPTQGFIVEALSASNLIFNNSMRAYLSGTYFNKTANSSSAGKFWLKLTTPNTSVFNSLAITYSDKGLEKLDAADSKSLNSGNDDFYSLIDNDKLIIQGKPAFNENDAVALGGKFSAAGIYTIDLSKKEGVFGNGQAIYLHDKQTGTFTNLQEKPYSFNTTGGEIAGRFEVVYKIAKPNVNITSGVKVYRDGLEFGVASDKKMDMVQVYDASGRQVLLLTPNDSRANFTLAEKGVYVVKVSVGASVYTQKIIK